MTVSVHCKSKHRVFKSLSTYPLAACVNFSQSVYRVEESVGSVEVCVDLDGTIEDYLTVYLFTIPGTATGECTHLITLEEVFINGSIDSL